MMNKHRIAPGAVASLLLTVVSLACGQVSACTAFVMGHGDSRLMAKNFDWYCADGFVVVNGRGIEKQAFSIDESDFNWISNFGSVTFNQFGLEFPLGGMNEAGLAIEELNAPPGVCGGGSIRLTALQWIQFQLDTSCSVEEVVASLGLICVEPLLFSVHFLVCDAAGQVAVVEIGADGTSAYISEDLPIPVLSNNRYLESLRYTKFFAGFGGDLPVVRREGSNERFVMAASLLRGLSEDTLEASHAFAILDSVRQDDTQWSIVYDPSALTIRFTTASGRTPSVLSFADLDFENPSGPSCVDIRTTRGGDIARSLTPCTYSENDKLLRRVYKQLVEIGALDESHRAIMEKIVKHPGVTHFR